jgi:hypothetical protein
MRALEAGFLPDPPGDAEDGPQKTWFRLAAVIAAARAVHLQRVESRPPQAASETPALELFAPQERTPRSAYALTPDGDEM